MRLVFENVRVLVSVRLLVNDQTLVLTDLKKKTPPLNIYYILYIFYLNGHEMIALVLQ